MVRKVAGKTGEKRKQQIQSTSDNDCPNDQLSVGNQI